MRVSVFGLGQVGGVTAACLARAGHEVIGVDVDSEKVAMLHAGADSVREPGLGRLLAEMIGQGSLRVTVDGKGAVIGSDLALICVATPSRADGGLDVSAVRAVGQLIGRTVAAAPRPYTVVLRSTVLPGTTEQVLLPALSDARQVLGSTLRVAVNPEFLREGSSLGDAKAPPFTLAGCDGDDAATALRHLYDWVDAPFVRTSIRTAEMVKCVSNAFHALKVAFANEVGDLCAALDGEAAEVVRVFLLDGKLNLGPAYLRPGFAFGGPCLAKDLQGLLAAGQQAGWSLPLLSAILPSNALQIERACQSILTTGRRVGVVGLAFKPATTDLRGSPVVELVRRLSAGGGRVRVLDRAVTSSGWSGLDLAGVERCDDVADLLAHAEIVVLAGGPDAAAVAAEVRPDQIVLDLPRGDFRMWWARQHAAAVASSERA